MGFTINDKNLISDITDEFYDIAYAEKEKYEGKFFEYPLDENIKDILNQLKPSTGNSIEYSQVETLDLLWEKLIDKSIKCLRYFDNREPFQDDSQKIAVTYGLDKLQQYHERYTKFESMLYGASSFYRDHVFHAIRTWMLGIFCLLKTIQDGENGFIYSIGIDGIEDQNFTKGINFFEKVSMWTVIALCHDLGYPLEKSQQILDRTRDMMKEFIQNPNVWNNFGFSGIQDNINDYIVKFMSTKMKAKTQDGQEQKEGELVRIKSKDNNKYIGRIQPKYYLKYTKSLDRFDHGIVSAIVLYKILLYFMESDFNLNDDYEYSYEDARQFYIRREILRAMSSHTCSDIYNIHLTTFSSLLFFCDELQEWGRKSWKDLYAGLLPDAISLKINAYNASEIRVQEKIDMAKILERDIIIKNIATIFERQYTYYKLIFRDGQYTKERNIKFIKEITIALNNNRTQDNKISIEYTMKSSEQNHFQINIREAPDFKEHFEKDIEAILKKSIYFKEISIIK